jgi:hypothetical protein
MRGPAFVESDGKKNIADVSGLSGTDRIDEPI